MAFVRGIRLLLTRLGVLSSHPAAFLLLAAFAVAWLVFDRKTFDWHAVAAVATLCMTLLIQRAEHRDTQAIHAKLDELLRASGEARSELAAVDQEEPEQIERQRKEARARDGTQAGKHY